MRVLISTKEFFPARGGLQASVDKLARRLATRGQYCAVLTQIPLREKRQPRILSARTVKKLFNRPVVINDKTFSYPVYRIQNPSEGLPIVIKSFKPDVMMCMVGGSHTVPFTRKLLESAGDLPTMIYTCDMEGVILTADPLSTRSHVIANAELIASLTAVFRRRPEVIPCIVDSNDCQVETSREVVLYINPHPRKGENLAWSIAEAAPGLKFVFQECWRLSEKRRLQITKRAQKLGNVEFRTVTDRPAEIYRDARVLLVPYGPERPRVVDEAQANGIPVVASDVPGLDESVGTGGVLINPASEIDEWISVLKRLNTDILFYEKLVTEAIRHSRRPEMKSDYLVDLFERELQYVIDRSKV